eukprot:161888_1
MGACLKIPSQQILISNHSLECALYATQGRHRSGMEDRHVITLSIPKHPSFSLFGVFDGFNGADASAYFADNIVTTLNAVDDLDNNDSIIHAIDDMDLKYLQSLHTEQSSATTGCTFVFALINRTSTAVSELTYTPYSTQDSAMTYPNLLHTPPSNSVPSCSHSKYEPMKFGSVVGDTASVCDEESEFKVRVFWAGDSRATCMSEAGQFKRLTRDHHCGVPTESERIVQAKGTITNDRIDGIVEVTRCFGCHAMKNDDSLPSNAQKMISVPECTTSMCCTNDRLLIYCDGLAKKWTDRQFNARCKHHVTQHACEDEKNGELHALKYLTEQAMDEGSRDNITVLSIKFK